jgi:hypothetical protein
MPGKRGGLSPVIRSQAPKGGEASDAVSALIVALDMMFKRTTKDKATDVDHAPRSMTLTTGHAYLPPCFRWQDSSFKYNRHIKLITDERLSVVGMGVMAIFKQGARLSRKMQMVAFRMHIHDCVPEVFHCSRRC